VGTTRRRRHSGKAGYTIIDVGAGKGTWLPVWSVAVGPTGRVIAEDIDKWSFDRARKAAEEQKLTNVEFVFGTSKDPMLPEKCADLVVVMDAIMSSCILRKC